MFTKIRFVIASITLAAVVGLASEENGVSRQGGRRVCASDVGESAGGREGIRHRRSDGGGIWQKGGLAEVWRTAGAGGD